MKTSRSKSNVLREKNLKRPVPEQQINRSGFRIKFTPVTAVTSIVLIILVLVAASAAIAQSSTITLGPNEQLEVFCDGRGIQIERHSRTHMVFTCRGNERDPEPTATASPTPIDPTATASPTPPADPDPTATPPGDEGPIAPYADAPPCPDHDSTTWHGLWDAEHGCHYDHTHNHNPYETVFAEQVQSWEQPISYPWQTPHENELKHSGYKYAYVTNPDCKVLAASDNCIQAALIQLHAVGSSLGITTRFHSFRAVLLICTPDGATCGTVQTGGWSDYGMLHCPYKESHCPLESDAEGITAQFLDNPPYRAAVPIDGLERALASGSNVQLWNNGVTPIVGQFYPERYNQLFQHDWTSADAWGGVNPADLSEVHLICPEGDCIFNHSTVRVYEMIANLLAGEVIHFTGFTNLQGEIDDSCSQVGPECVPLIIDGAPGGSASFRVRPSETGHDDYDIYFCNGQLCDADSPDATTAGWIKYPN